MIVVQQIQGGNLQIPLGTGAPLVIVGANGTGKSTLLGQILRQSQPYRRISAMRQIFLQSAEFEMSRRQQKAQRKALEQFDNQDQSRYMEQNPGQRPIVVINELIDAQREYDHRIALAAKSGDQQRLTEAIEAGEPIQLTNALLKKAFMPVQLEVSGAHSIVTVRRDSSAPYNFAEMSDGEKAAILLAAEVLTAPPGVLIGIDEPERHLHRSVSVPLISQLIQERDDLRFAISTHDIDLAKDIDGANILIVREYRHAPRAWDLNLLDTASEIEEDVQRAILGARRKVLFVEGASTSLDLALYGVLFPGVLVRPVGSCSDVVRSVKGFNNSAELHRAAAFGIVDRDTRTDEQLAALQASNIFGLDFYSVEAIYYHPAVIDRISDTVSEMLGVAPDIAKANARARILDEFARSRDNLIELRAKQLSRELALKALGEYDRAGDTKGPIEVDIEAVDAEVEVDFDALLAASNIEDLISRYPIKRTGVPAFVATSLGFRSSSQYQSVVRTRVAEDEMLRNLVLEFLGGLPTAIGG